ncbi:MAG: glycosyltransferase family 39 protein [Kiritimatiellia bacterium]
MAARPFESRLQDLVYNVDVGVGREIIRFGLYILSILFLVLFYTVVQFKGLKEEEAMDYAQLGRNLMQQKSFVTQCVRPATAGHFLKLPSVQNPLLMRHPDILHPPLYPLLLGAAFKVTGVPFAVETNARTFPAEQRVIIPVSHLFSILTGLLVFMLGRRLFDKRVATTGLIVYYLSDWVWRESCSGLPLAMTAFLATLAVYLAVRSAQAREQASRRAHQWMVPLIFSAVFCAAAFLTRYGAVAMVPVIGLYVYLTFGRKSWAWMLVFLLVFTVCISPWLARNFKVSGKILGLAPQTALVGSPAFPGDSFFRTLNPDISYERVQPALKNQWMKRMGEAFSENLKLQRAGLLGCFFLVTFFYAFVRPHVQRLRWCILLGLLALMVIAGFFGESTARLGLMFWPLILLYGLAFFFILLDRFEFTLHILNKGITMLVVALCALPMLFALLPPRPGIPYPPYFQPYIVHVSGILKPGELMCTDMPWATAWYGQRISIQLPQTLEEFYQINDLYQKINGLYLTTITRDKPYIRGLVSGPDKTWFPILERRIPADFPLTDGFPIADMDQIFLTDRERLVK